MDGGPGKQGGRRYRPRHVFRVCHPYGREDVGSTSLRGSPGVQDPEWERRVGRQERTQDPDLGG